MRVRVTHGGDLLNRAVPFSINNTRAQLRRTSRERDGHFFFFSRRKRSLVVFSSKRFRSCPFGSKCNTRFCKILPTHPPTRRVYCRTCSRTQKCLPGIEFLGNKLLEVGRQLQVNSLYKICCDRTHCAISVYEMVSRKTRRA